MRWSRFAMLLFFVSALSLAVVSSIAVGSDGNPEGRIDPSLLPFLNDPAPVYVIVFLRNQPLWGIAEEVHAARLPQVRTLELELRAISLRGRSAGTFPDTAAERAEARSERTRLTPRDRAEMHEIASEIRDLLDAAKHEIGMRMRQAVEAEQDQLARNMEALGGRTLYSYTIENAVAAVVPGVEIPDISNLPGVAYVELEGTGVGLLDVSLPSIGASAFHNAGETGGTFRPAACDTGADTGHPALSGHTWSSSVFHASASGQTNYWDNSSSTDDLQGHGSHVSGIMLSTDASYRGLAYGATRALNLKAGYRTTSGGSSMRWSDARAAVDWGINTCSYPPHAVNFSFGDNGTLSQNDTSFARFWDAVVDAEATPVAIAAGNSGPNDKTINDPAGAYNILCVANMDDQNTSDRSDDTIRDSSSRGPVGTARKKPDITAPGTNIMSCNYDWETENDFWNMTGTSMAAPHVVGAMTLLADVGVTDPKAQKALLINTAEDWGTAGWDKTYGWGYMDLEHLYFHRADVFQDTIKPTSDPDYYFDLYRVTGMTSGEKATLVWNRHVLYNGSSDPTTWYTLNNLNLHLYSEEESTVIATNAGATDNVEQVKSDRDAALIIRVDTPSNSFNGVAEESYALATEEGATKASAHTATVATESSSYTPPLNAKFRVRARIHNTGDVIGHSCRIELGALPAGLQKLAGDDIQALGKVAAHSYSNWAEWTFRATTAGAKTLSLAGFSYGYGVSRQYAKNVTVTPGEADTVKPETIALLDAPNCRSGGTEKVSNGGFESDLSSWMSSGSVSVSTTEYHGGAKSACMGGVNAGSTYQDVALSSSATRIVLQFWYRTMFLAFSGSQRVSIRDTSGNVLWTLVNEQTHHDWQMLTADLTQYKGTTVRIHFYSAGDGIFPATMCVDDVSITQNPTLYVARATPWRLLAKDDRAGVDYSQYQFDGGSWNTGSQFMLSTQSDATHTVTYRSVDNSGNVEDAHSIGIDLDNTPPNTVTNLGDSFLAGSVDKVVWGSFEHPVGIYGWVRSGDTSTSTTVYHSGAQSALIAGGTAAGSIYQDIPISGSATNAVLSLWYRPIATGDIWSAGWQSVTLKDTSGNTLESLYMGVNWDPGSFRHVVVDVTRFRGSTLRLEFAVSGSMLGATSGMYVDDVCLLEDPTVYLSSTTQFSLVASDTKSGVQYKEHCVDGGDWSTSAQFTIEPGDHVLSYRSVDNLNLVEPTNSLPVKVDSSDSDGTIMIASGSTETGGVNVSLSLTATPSVTQMRFRNEVGDWSAWTVYASTHAWTLTPGAGTKTVYAQFRDSALNVSPERYDTIVQGEATQVTIPEAKKLEAGTVVTLSGKIVSACFSSHGMLYVQEADGSSGIGVILPATFAPGTLVELVGPVETVYGERCLQATNAYMLAPGPPPTPVFLKNADVGGADFYYREQPPTAGQKGVLGGVGLNNVGLLVSSGGRVSAGGPTCFIITDGSTDSVLWVDATHLTTMPEPGTYAVVTGISLVEEEEEHLLPFLLPRNDTDVTIYGGP